MGRVEEAQLEERNQPHATGPTVVADVVVVVVMKRNGFMAVFSVATGERVRQFQPTQRPWAALHVTRFVGQRLRVFPGFMQAQQ